MPDGTLTIGSYNGRIILCDVKTGNKINTLFDHTGSVSCLVVLPDGSLASGGDNGTIIIWDIKSGNKINTLSGHTDSVKCLAVLPNGSFIWIVERRLLQIILYKINE